MGDSSRRVFFSYAHEDESKRIVDALDEELRKSGIVAVRDKNDLNYKDLIREFMKRIGDGHAVIAVISDKYLRSKNCMFELVEMTENTQESLQKRIFPVMLPDAAEKVFDAAAAFQYIDHWNGKIAELTALIRAQANQSNLQYQQETLNDYDRYRDRISRITQLLSNMNVLSSNVHEQTGFASLIDALHTRLGTDAAPSRPTARMADATGSDRGGALVNLALNAHARQSSVDWNGPARLAVDGNTDGDYNNNSVTATRVEDEPWWQVELAQPCDIAEVILWNRTDMCEDRLSNFVVFVSSEDMEGRSLDELMNDDAVTRREIRNLGGNDSLAIPMPVKGRYVRIQLKGKKKVLSLAEVQVMGSSPS